MSQTAVCIRIALRAYDHKLLEKSAQDVVNTAKRAGAHVVGPINLPTRIRKYTVLRSPFIDKKSRDQFEQRIHKRAIMIDIGKTDNQVIEGLKEFALPPGVDIKIKVMGERT